jgi:hypothetical protein
MAVVRLSDSLIQGVLTNARNVHDKELVKVRDNIPKDLGMRVYDQAFRDYIASMNALPAVFFDTTDNIRIDGVYYNRGTGKDNIRIPMQYNLTNKVRVPYKYTGVTEFGFVNGPSYGYGVTLDADDRRWTDSGILQEIEEYDAAINAVTAKQTAFVDSVRKVLNAHTTLAPALKMWPALWDLIPEPYKNKHREVKTREKREDAGVDVDLNSLTAAVTLSKITR